MIKIETFMGFFGWKCFFIPNFKYSPYDFQATKLIRSGRNFSVLFDRLNGMMTEIGYGLEKDVNISQLYIKKYPTYKENKWGSKRLKTEMFFRKWSDDNLYVFMERYWRSDDNEIEKKIVSIINRLTSNWINEKEKNRYSEAAASAAMQKQREFIAYK